MYDYLKNKSTGAISKVSKALTATYLGTGDWSLSAEAEYDKQQNQVPKKAQAKEKSE